MTILQAAAAIASARPDLFQRTLPGPIIEFWSGPIPEAEAEAVAKLSIVSRRLLTRSTLIYSADLKIGKLLARTSDGQYISLSYQSWEYANVVQPANAAVVRVAL